MARIVRVLVLLALADTLWHVAYRQGYSKAEAQLSGQWYEGTEGYCLAEKHVGECHG